MPGFLFADTNPKAAGIFGLLLLLASHPCRALRSTLAFPVHTHMQTHTDEHTIDYKYSGQDRRYVQHNVRRGHNTHCAHFKPATSSLSALFCGEKKKNCTSALLVLFIQASLSVIAHKLARLCHCLFFSSAFSALIRCVDCCKLSQSSGVVCLFVSEGERWCLESTCATQRDTLHQDRLSR